MRQRALDALLQGLEQLTRPQRQRLVAELAAGERQAAAVEVIERSLGDTPCCPHCAAEGVVRNGSADGLQRYKGRPCRRPFNALTGSPLAGLHRRGKWLDQAAVRRDGLALPRARERRNVSPPPALRWRHRFLGAPGPVLVGRDRSGSSAAFILDAADSDHLVAALTLTSILARAAIFCPDGSTAMAAAARQMKIAHRPVHLSAGIRVLAGVCHGQTPGGWLNPASLLARAVRV